MPASTIITLLHADHLVVSDLFTAISETTSRSVRRRAALFSERASALTVHADFEEEHVYPKLAKAKTNRPQVLEAIEEHLQFRNLLAALTEFDPADERWLAKLTVLEEDVTHHVKEEEDEVFTALQKAMGKDELIALGEAFQVAKEGIPHAGG